MFSCSFHYFCRGGDFWPYEKALRWTLLVLIWWFTMPYELALIKQRFDLPSFMTRWGGAWFVS